MVRLGLAIHEFACDRRELHNETRGCQGQALAWRRIAGSRL